MQGAQRPFLSLLIDLLALILYLYLKNGSTLKYKNAAKNIANTENTNPKKIAHFPRINKLPRTCTFLYRKALFAADKHPFRHAIRRNNSHNFTRMATTTIISPRLCFKGANDRAHRKTLPEAVDFRVKHIVRPIRLHHRNLSYEIRCLGHQCPDIQKFYCQQ